MDIKQLQFLCALDSHRHFGRAAEACCVTQPTLSMRLRNLEDELGVSLIKRKQRFEGLTPEGQRLLGWAKQVISAYDGMRSEAARLKGALVGTLRIGVVPQSHVSLMPLLKKLLEQAPQIRFKLYSLSSEQVIHQLDSNQLDIGLSYLEQSYKRPGMYHVLPFGKPSVGLLYHPNHFSFHYTETIAWGALATLPLGLISPSMKFRQGIDRSARLHEVELQPVIESDSVDHLIEAASQGLCCTLVPMLRQTTDPTQAYEEPPSYAHPALRIIPMAASQPQPSLALICRDTSMNGDMTAEVKLAQALMLLARETLDAKMDA